MSNLLLASRPVSCESGASKLVPPDCKHCLENSFRILLAALEFCRAEVALIEARKVFQDLKYKHDEGVCFLYGWDGESESLCDDCKVYLGEDLGSHKQRLLARSRAKRKMMTAFRRTENAGERPYAPDPQESGRVANLEAIGMEE